MARTSEYWRQWINGGVFPDHPWRKFLQRSALALKGLTYAPTGALLAASTTSLPETPQGERNWDYRYAWIRDSTFALWGLYTLGLDREANDFFYFIADVARDADLQIMYGVGGETELEEHELKHLTGYEGAVPVRIGNGAQPEAALCLVTCSTRLPAVKSREQLSMACADLVSRSRRPEVLEGRSRDHWSCAANANFVSSKAVCCPHSTAVRAGGMHDEPSTSRWRSRADEILADICANARQAWLSSSATAGRARCVLTPPATAHCAIDDDRVRATVLAIAYELTETPGAALPRPRIPRRRHGEDGTFRSARSGCPRG